ESHRHDLDAVPLDRAKALLLVGFRLLVDAEHERHARPVDVGVHEADAALERRERERQVRRDRRLAHAALAARDGDDAVDPGNGLRTPTDSAWGLGALPEDLDLALDPRGLGEHPID